jgi:hypothetical protein
VAGQPRSASRGSSCWTLFNVSASRPHRLLFEGTQADRQHLEPDAPRFPTYILVAAALSFGVVHALVEEYDRAAEPLQPEELDAAGAVLRRHKRRAERAAHMAIEDVLDALGVTTVHCVCTYPSILC